MHIIIVITPPLKKKKKKKLENKSQTTYVISFSKFIEEMKIWKLKWATISI